MYGFEVIENKLFNMQKCDVSAKKGEECLK